MMQIEINGESRKVEEGKVLQTLMQELGLDPQVTIAEVNQLILQKNEYETTSLKEGDQVELIRFMGGGAE